MTTTVLTTGLAIACLSLVATAAECAEAFQGRMLLTSASSNCPAGMQDVAQALSVSVLLPEGRAVMPGMSMSGVIRDFAVAGCTVSFSGGGTGAALTPASLTPADAAVRLERGCRGFCGL